MTDEIIKQGPGFIIYRTTDPGPAIPYPPVQHKDSKNHGFRDLRDHPDLVEGIPEVQKSPGLAAIVRALNLPGSTLMSLGCECKMNNRPGHTDGYTHYFHAYTDFAYRDAALGVSEAEMIKLAERLLAEVKPSQKAVFGYELGIQKMRHFFGEPDVYNISMGLSGYGRTEDEAKDAYEVAAQATAAAIVALVGNSPEA